MKTKSFFHWVLMAALTLGLSINLVNIVSDDDDDWNPENKYEMTTAHLNTIWAGFSKMFLEGSDSFFLDGKPTNIITWKKAWE
jgi:hypothetical protein